MPRRPHQIISAGQWPASEDAQAAVAASLQHYTRNWHLFYQNRLWQYGNDDTDWAISSRGYSWLTIDDESAPPPSASEDSTDAMMPFRLNIISIAPES